MQIEKDQQTLLLRGASTSFVIQVVGFGLGYLASILFARWMGSTEYGIYSYVHSWALLLATFAGLSLPSTTLRFVPAYVIERDWSRMRGLIIQSQRLVTGVGLLVASLGTVLVLTLNRLNQLQFAVSLAVGLWMVPLWAHIHLFSSISRSFGRISLALVPSRIVRPTALILAAFLAVSLGYELTGIRLVTYAEVILVTLVGLQFWRFWRSAPEELTQASPLFATSEWLQVAMPLVLVSGFVMAQREIGVLVIGVLLPPDQVAIYTAASKTGQFAAFPLLAINTIAVPMFASAFAKGDRDDLRKLVSTVVRWSSAASFVVALILIVFAPIILGLFGTDFLAAQRELTILVLSGLVVTGMGPTIALLSVTGYQRVSVLVTGVTAVVSISLTLGGVYLWGTIGAAIATLVSTLVSTIWQNLLAARYLGIQPSIAMRAIAALRGAETL